MNTMIKNSITFLVCSFYFDQLVKQLEIHQKYYLKKYILEKIILIQKNLNKS